MSIDATVPERRGGGLIGNAAGGSISGQGFERTRAARCPEEA